MRLSRRAAIAAATTALALPLASFAQGAYPNKPIRVLAVGSDPTFLDLMRRQKSLNFAPGDEFLYSNTGYALLSIVVKRASGKSLRDFAAERIFTPLGMTNTEFRDDHRRVVPNGAIGSQASCSRKATS